MTEWLATPAGLRPGPTQAEKWEKAAFTFCKMGTTGLIAWVLTPAVFVLVVAALAIALYGRAIALGVTRSKCFLRRPTYIIGLWATVGIADAVWLLVPR